MFNCKQTVQTYF